MNILGKQKCKVEIMKRSGIILPCFFVRNIQLLGIIIYSRLN